MPERFECTTLAKQALYKYSSFPFLYSTQLSLVADIVVGPQDPLSLKLLDRRRSIRRGWGPITMGHRRRFDCFSKFGTV